MNRKELLARIERLESRIYSLSLTVAQLKKSLEKSDVVKPFWRRGK